MRHLWIGGECDGFVQVLLGRLSDPFLHAEVGEKEDAAASDVARAGESDERHAHPEGVEAGGAAGIGEGIEIDVDAAMEEQVVAGRSLGGENSMRSAVRPWAALQRCTRSLVFSRGTTQENARPRDAPADLAPELAHFGGDFAEIVQATEGDMTGLK